MLRVHLQLLVPAIALVACGSAPTPAPTPSSTPQPPATATTDPCAADMLRLIAYADGVVPMLRASYDTLSEPYPASDIPATDALLSVMDFAWGVDPFQSTDCSGPFVDDMKAAAEAIIAYGQKRIAVPGGGSREEAAALSALLDIEVELERLKAAY